MFALYSVSRFQNFLLFSLFFPRLLKLSVQAWQEQSPAVCDICKAPLQKLWRIEEKQIYSEFWPFVSPANFTKFKAQTKKRFVEYVKQLKSGVHCYTAHILKWQNFYGWWFFYIKISKIHWRASLFCKRACKYHILTISFTIQLRLLKPNFFFQNTYKILQ